MAAWQERLTTAARRRGWTLGRLPVQGVGELLTLQRAPRVSGAGVAPGGGPDTGGVTQAGQRVYLSAGIHGDEPAGPLALAALVEADPWPASWALWMCPCLNPGGFARRTRENAAGVDLNRDYRTRRTPEVRAHVEWLEQQPAFELAILLHEDWEAGGFYLYELNPDGRPSAAETVVAAVEAACPIDRSPLIEGRPAREGIVRPVADLAGRPDWPEAFYLIARKTRHNYTLEAPSDYPLPVRVAALETAVRTLLGVPAKTVLAGPPALP